MDYRQINEYGRKFLFGGDGYMFVRFAVNVVKDSDSDNGDEFIYEHCVAEGGWYHPSIGAPGVWVDWECPCEECKPWLPRWKHLYADLWGCKRVMKMEIPYEPFTEEEWYELDLETYAQKVGREWECVQWELGYGTPPVASEDGEEEDGEEEDAGGEEDSDALWDHLDEEADDTGGEEEDDGNDDGQGSA